MAELGVCQWFHYQDRRSVERALGLLEELGVRRLRTGISWADYHRPHGRDWYDWQMAALSHLDLLVSIWHTPPSIAEGGTCASPPRRLGDYADFVQEVIERYGGSIEALELWNEPNNKMKWDFEAFDPDWQKFGTMIGAAAERAAGLGTTTVLGGMIPVDHSWLELMGRHGALDHMHVVGFHAFPGMWWPDRPCWDWRSHWQGWDSKTEYLREHAGARPLWVTETGRATWDCDAAAEGLLDEQVRRLEDAVRAPVDRMYWYSLIDLDPARESIEGFHVEENEYHMGLVRFEGPPKPAFHRLRSLVEELDSSWSGGRRR